MDHDLITGARFLGATTFILFAIVLSMINRGKVQSKVYEHSRWLLALGSLALGIHNLSQFLLQMREVSPTMAWAFNLSFYAIVIPAYNLGELNLLRAGHDLRKSIIMALAFISVIYLLLGVGLFTNLLVNDDAPWCTLTFAAAVVFSLYVFHASVKLQHETQVVSQLLNAQELESRHKALRYTCHSIRFVMLVSLATPWICACGNLTILGLYGLLIYVLLIWYLCSFYLYGNNMAEVVDVADEIVDARSDHDYSSFNFSAEKSSNLASHDIQDKVLYIERVINSWLEVKAYTDPNLNFEKAIEQMGISVRELNFYLQNVLKVDGFNIWKSNLRVEEAKRLLLKHPDYSYEAIAQACGYVTGTSMARAFKAHEGVTPIQWLSSQSKNQ